MTAWILVGASVALLALTTVVWVRARRTGRRRAERAAALERLASLLDDLAAHATPPLSSRSRPLGRREHRQASAPPDPTTRLPGRAALVDDLLRRVDDMRAADTRLSLAVVHAGGEGLALERTIASLAEAARVVWPEHAVYRAGERALVLVVAGGRAEGIAAVARLEATLDREPRLDSTVVELRGREGAAELLTRALLAPSPERPMAAPG
jgi:hypothetical protein